MHNCVMLDLDFAWRVRDRYRELELQSGSSSRAMENRIIYLTCAFSCNLNHCGNQLQA